jgi:hypothetical protein
MRGESEEEKEQCKRVKENPEEDTYDMNYVKEFCLQSIRAIEGHGIRCIGELIQNIQELTLFSRPIFFKDKDGQLNPLSYCPFLSVLSLDFKDTSKPSIRQEYPYSIYSSEGLQEHLPPYLSDPMFKDLPIAALNRDTSYFALNWRFLFNLRVRSRDYRAPNLLIYYAFNPLRVIGGPQSDSHGLVSTWIKDMHSEYFMGA